MTRTGGPVRKSVSLGMSLLMLVMTVAIPVLERSELVNQPVAESEHNPATCPTGHDHTVCTQIGANAAAPAARVSQRAPRALSVALAPADAVSIRPEPFPDGHPSRAPPHA
jgi:hypothetical protein